VLTRGHAPDGWVQLSAPADVARLPEAHYVLIEGGAATAASFIAADLVDRLLLYRAPLLIGGGRPMLCDIGLTQLQAAHGRWGLASSCTLGEDVLDIYHRIRG